MKQISSNALGIRLVLIPFIFFLCFGASLLKVYGQTKLISSLNEKIIEINVDKNLGSFTEFQKFGDGLTGVSILALGEETHGIKEFMDFRGTLIRHLVTDLGYKNIILEADFSGCHYLNKYVQGGKIDKYQALLSAAYGIWNTQEFLNTIEWLRSYNLKQDPSNRVAIYGADMQKTVPAAYLSTGVMKLQKPITSKAKEGLKALLNSYNNTSNEDRRNLIQLQNEIEAEISLYPDTSIIAQDFQTVIQSIEWLNADNWYKKEIVRDKYMATNVEWIYEREPNKKIIFLAHNLHISKNPVYNDIERAGNFLRKKFMEKYYALGFSFYTGKFSAYDEREKRMNVFEMSGMEKTNSSEFLLSKTKYSNFVLDFKNAAKNPEPATPSASAPEKKETVAAPKKSVFEATP
ncbi:MAG: erythromycin esterase family protein, partial [Flavobacterium sp.]